MADRAVMRIAVVRALHLGDLLCAVPALRALRREFPDARVTLVGLPWARELVPRLARYLDAFAEFPGFPGIPERDVEPARLARFLRDALREPFDLAVQLHGSGAYINEFVALLGARRMVAFHRLPTLERHNATFVEWLETGTEVERLLALPRALGWPLDGDALELELHDEDRAALVASAPAFPLGSAPYACIHPGARFASRRWSADRFAAIADALAARGLTIAITGTRAEAPVTAAVRARMRAPSIDFTGTLGLGAFAALIAGASLVVCNDTGTSHVAAAVGTKSVVVASGSDVARWAPRDRQRHRVLWHDVPCRPCMHQICPTAHECAAGVSVESVLDAADQLIVGGTLYA